MSEEEFIEIDQEENECSAEDEAKDKCLDLLFEKYPDAEWKSGTLEEIPVGKYEKVCYSVIYDEDDGFTVRGFMIAAIDKETHSNAILYRSANM